MCCVPSVVDVAICGMTRRPLPPRVRCAYLDERRRLIEHKTSEQAERLSKIGNEEARRCGLVPPSFETNDGDSEGRK